MLAGPLLKVSFRRLIRPGVGVRAAEHAILAVKRIDIHATGAMNCKVGPLSFMTLVQMCPTHAISEVLVSVEQVLG